MDHLFSLIQSLQRLINTLKYNTWILGTKHVEYTLQTTGPQKNNSGNGLGNCDSLTKIIHDYY